MVYKGQIRNIRIYRIYFLKIKYLALNEEAFLWPYKRDCNVNTSGNAYQYHIKIREKAQLFLIS